MECDNNMTIKNGVSYSNGWLLKKLCYTNKNVTKMSMIMKVVLTLITKSKNFGQKISDKVWCYWELDDYPMELYKTH
jgi:hypothetical protein